MTARGTTASTDLPPRTPRGALAGPSSLLLTHVPPTVETTGVAGARAVHGTTVGDTGRPWAPAGSGSSDEVLAAVRSTDRRIAAAW